MTSPETRGLGRGVARLIPQGPPTGPAAREDARPPALVPGTPTDRAAAALAGLRTVPVPVAVVHAAALLLGELAEGAPEPETRAVAAEVHTLLLATLPRPQH
ncbi:hypothetical protein ACN20G_32790 (plasmid) [Streptomyces sp. BI20]|uniref:hypothetical protein n=1 Tax=Streptomyces sp. BI20 TaxID=3403460 RepID=UPI003C746191